MPYGTGRMQMLCGWQCVVLHPAADGCTVHRPPVEFCVSKSDNPPASKMQVWRFDIREDILFLYCKVQKWVEGVDSGVQVDENRHNSANMHPKNPSYAGNSISWRHEAFGTGPEPQNGRQTHKIPKMRVWVRQDNFTLV